MRMRTNRNGFALIELVLLLVIVGLLAGTGYYVWHSKQATDAVFSDTQSNHTTSASDTRKFTSKDYRFMFLYPTQWGNAHVYPNDLTAPVHGESYVISFNNLSKVRGFFASKDWQPASNEDSNQLDPKTFTGCKVMNDKSVKFVPLYTAADACVGVRSSIIQDDTGKDVRIAYLYAEKQLTGGSSEVLEFDQQGSVLDDYSDAALKAYGFQGSFGRELIDVVKSVKSL